MDLYFLIPKNVRTRMEFFTGFGWFELFILLIGLGVGILLFGIAFLITHSFITLLFIVVGGTAGFLLGKPNPYTGMNALSFLKAFKAFKTKRNRYFYRFGDGR
ncbi:PrgI family mobile element protein [Paenibacillus tyrfis]|uniref:PrgI family mobile element protein n=1 Tax=Paenibacillus tyrfis TaxID=1501230 RepID=UPI0020A1BB2C|nr:PrgI family protein [Paenibacillus tyrfis]MCP1312093.1 PrgI family protein [Paenibacillus tyrfis]